MTATTHIILRCRLFFVTVRLIHRSLWRFSRCVLDRSFPLTVCGPAAWSTAPTLVSLFFTCCHMDQYGSIWSVRVGPGPDLAPVCGGRSSPWVGLLHGVLHCSGDSGLVLSTDKAHTMVENMLLFID